MKKCKEQYILIRLFFFVESDSKRACAPRSDILETLAEMKQAVVFTVGFSCDQHDGSHLWYLDGALSVCWNPKIQKQFLLLFFSSVVRSPNPYRSIVTRMAAMVTKNDKWLHCGATWLSGTTLALAMEFKWCQPSFISQSPGIFIIILNKIYFCLILWEPHILCAFARNLFSNEYYSILSEYILHFYTETQ